MEWQASTRRGTIAYRLTAITKGKNVKPKKQLSPQRAPAPASLLNNRLNFQLPRPRYGIETCEQNLAITRSKKPVLEVVLGVTQTGVL